MFFIDQERSKLNITINASSSAQTLRYYKIIKSPFNKNKTATIKSKWNCKFLLPGLVEEVQCYNVPI